MHKYSSILVAGMVWASQAFCGSEDVTDFLNAVQPRQVSMVAVPKQECITARRSAGLAPRMDDDMYTVVQVLVPASQVAEDGSIQPK